MKRILLFALVALSFLPLSARQPSRGYRGFLDWSNSLTRQTLWSYSDGTSHFDLKENLFYTGFSTSHGYQFNPNLYVGAGFGLEHNTEWDSNLVPLFLDIRTDQQFGKFTPFADLRFGYNASGGGGMHLSPSIGYRFNWGRKVGVNLAAGYTLHVFRVDMFDIENPSQDDLGYWQVTYLGKGTRTYSYFSFRLGFDF